MTTCDMLQLIFVYLEIVESQFKISLFLSSNIQKSHHFNVLGSNHPRHSETYLHEYVKDSWLIE